MSDASNDFNILEVAPGASFDEVRRAYRDAVRVWHPDRFGADTRLRRRAEEKIRDINDAYARLEALYATTTNTASRSGNSVPDYAEEQTVKYGERSEPRRSPVWRSATRAFAPESRAAWRQTLVIATAVAVLTMAIGASIFQFIAVHAGRVSQLTSQPGPVRIADTPTDQLARVIRSVGATPGAALSTTLDKLQGSRPHGDGLSPNLPDTLERPTPTKTAPPQTRRAPVATKVWRPQTGMELAHSDSGRGYGSVFVLNEREEDIAFEIATLRSDRSGGSVIRAIYVRAGEKALIGNLGVGVYWASVISPITVELRSGRALYRGIRHVLPEALSFSQIESSHKIESLRYSITVPQHLP
jgi:hypothetical protein